MSRLTNTIFSAALALVASSTAGLAQSQPIIFAALAGPGPLSQTNADVGSFNFATPNGDVDLNRPSSVVLASPNDPPVFFLAPPGGIIDIMDDGIDGSLDASAGILD